MSIRTAKAVWEGTVKEGKGAISIPDNQINEKYSYSTRFAETKGSGPEELLAAAEAGCYSMALSEVLVNNGFNPKRLDTTAKVHIDKVGDAFKITTIELNANGVVPGINANEFQTFAERAKLNSPICQTVGNVNIKLHAQLQN